MLLAPLKERREVVRAAIMADPERAARQIAAEIGVTTGMVVRHYLALVREGRIPAGLKIRGVDGRMHPPSIRTRETSGLLYRMGQVREIAKMIEEGRDSWLKADPKTRRLFWLSAVRLAEAIGERIDVNTGCLASHWSPHKKPGSAKG